MQIVIPGALPPEPAAQSLMPYMAQRTPKLTRWFAGCSAHVQRINLLETACTMPEYWAFTQKHAFVPTEKQNFSSGLGPFLEPNTQQPDAPVWIAELVHVSPSRDGAALL
ncbi:MAG: hypothetical protein CML17_08440, partial [Pusillimonas sp.]|nr:hypothetical protein [Pusillimonas sp.]